MIYKRFILGRRTKISGITILFVPTTHTHRARTPASVSVYTCLSLFSHRKWDGVCVSYGYVTVFNHRIVTEK